MEKITSRGEPCGSLFASRSTCDAPGASTRRTPGKPYTTTLGRTTHGDAPTRVIRHNSYAGSPTTGIGKLVHAIDDRGAFEPASNSSAQSQCPQERTAHSKPHRCRLKHQDQNAHAEKHCVPCLQRFCGGPQFIFLIHWSNGAQIRRLRGHGRRHRGSGLARDLYTRILRQRYPA